MSLPTTDPVRSRIRQAAVYGLSHRLIRAGEAIRYSDAGDGVVNPEGYWNTVSRAYDPIRSYEQFDEFPCFNVSTEDETCDNASNVQIEQQQSKLHISFTLQIVGYLNESNDTALAQDRLLADVQKYFGINYHIPSSTGAATAFNCYYLSSDPFSTERNKPNCGIIIRYRVWYRQFLTDPAQSG